MNTEKQPSMWVYIAFPAIAILLGWGLRGYIGGGPFGAMIPGTYMALSLSLLLGHSMKQAASLALMCSIGVGFGGDMTYGQTLGLAIGNTSLGEDTTAYGLLGCGVKGAVWGLLGGAYLGVGLTRKFYSNRALVIGILVSMLAFYVGVKLINQPKLIYFSDPYIKPRGESWAGLLFAGIAFLGFMRSQCKNEYANLPLKFALFGLIGGGLGFSVGTLWMVFEGPFEPGEVRWFGRWKAMEFTFGLLLGGFWGLCAYLNRNALQACADTGEEDQMTPAKMGWSVFGVFAVATTAFFVFPAILNTLPEQADDYTAFHSLIKYTVGSVQELYYSFMFFGGVCLLIAMHSSRAAWHVAISVMFLHTVLDFNDDLYGENGLNMSPVLGGVVVLGCVGTVIYLVERFIRREYALSAYYLLAVWSCMAIALPKTFLKKIYLYPAEGAVGGVELLFTKHISTISLLVIFMGSALITTVFIQKQSKSVEMK